MMKVVTAVRLGEGFLSKRQVLQAARPMNEMNRLRHELAKAQQAFNLVGGGRQSRFTAWKTYSQLVAKSAREAVPATGHGGPPNSSSQVSQEIEHFIPNSFRKDGRRVYQVLVCRPHGCADTFLALTERVWRCSRPKKSKATSITTSAKPFDAPLKTQYAAVVQLVQLEHRVSGLYRATSYSPSLVVDPHGLEADTATILYETRFQPHGSTSWFASPACTRCLIYFKFFCLSFHRACFPKCM